MYRSRRLEGSFVTSSVSFEGRTADVVALVPDVRFKKGFLLGQDWVAKAGLAIVDGQLTFRRRRKRC
jgi:hypothetical protein